MHRLWYGIVTDVGKYLFIVTLTYWQPYKKLIQLKITWQKKKWQFDIQSIVYIDPALAPQEQELSLRIVL